jgi:hypothetical protein
MGDAQGFDNMFNDGLFKTGLRTSIRQRPSKWPAAVTEMRKHTFYGGQGMSKDHDVGHSTYTTSRHNMTQQSKPAPPPKWRWLDATRSRFMANNEIAGMASSSGSRRD